MPRFPVVTLVFVASISCLALGGCGGCNDNDPNGHLADAPPLIDTSIDASVAPVTVTVTNLGEPTPGAHVYFVNPDGSLAKTADTDATGSASAIVEPGGSVTVLKPFQQPQAGKFVADELRTFAGVKPGDHLLLTRTVPDAVTFQLVGSIAPGTESPFRVRYDVFSTCAPSEAAIFPGGGGGGSGDPTPGGPVTLQGCGTTADVAIVASEDVTPRIATGIATTINWLGTIFHAGATLSEGGTLDLSADTYDAPQTVTFTLSNAPDTTSSIQVQHAPIVAHGPLGPFSIDATDSPVTLNEARTGATKAITDISVFATNHHEVVDWGDFHDTVTLDLGPVLLKELVGPTFDLAANKLVWTEAATGATPDVTLVGVTLRRIDQQQETQTIWHWEVVGPYAAGQFVYPTLPSDVFDYTPKPDDDVFSVDPVVNVKLTGGYDALRAHAFDIADRQGFTGVVAGASGRAVIVTSTPVVLTAR